VFDISPEYQAGMARKTQEQYLLASFRWVQGMFGKENVIGASIHHDEGDDVCAHGHILVLPVKDGSLNCASFMGGVGNNMSLLQSDFYDKVGRNFGLERGVKNSKSTHVDLKEYRKKVNHSLPLLERDEKKLRLEIDSLVEKKRLLTDEIQACSDDLNEVNIFCRTALEARLKARWQREVAMNGSIRCIDDVVEVDEYDRVNISKPTLSQSSPRRIR